MGVIPYNSVVRLKALCLKDVVPLHEHCLFLFRIRTKVSSDLLWSELSLKRNASDEERNSNQNWGRTFVAKIPCIGKVFIAVTFHIVRKYILGWLGSIHDCYVLQCRSIHERFDRFCTASILEAVNESNKKEYLETLNASNKRRNDFDEETDFECFHFEVENSPVWCLTGATHTYDERVTCYRMEFHIWWEAFLNRIRMLLPLRKCVKPSARVHAIHSRGVIQNSAHRIYHC